MMTVKNVMGIDKSIFNFKVKIRAFFYFLPELFKGKMSFRRFIAFLKRLLYFLGKMQHNKFVKIGKNTRVDLYCPGFPSKAFFTACRKFSVFEGKLPCTTVLISVTSACKYHCMHCYQKHDKGKDIDIENLVSSVKRLQDMGIAFFNIEGGEPFLVYDRLLKVCQAIDDRSEIWVNSTGYSITIDRLSELKRHNVTAIMFSLHTPVPEELNKFMGDDKAWDTMKAAIEMCHKVGISVAFNSCLQVSDFYNGKFESIMESAKGFNASIIQIIKPKPSGGLLEVGIDPFTPEDMRYIRSLVDRYNLERQYSDYPSISAQIIEEDKSQFGCTAGGTDRFYINAKGDVQPCEFLNVSFGNIGEENFEGIYKKMRDCFEVPGECWLCEKYSSKVLEICKKYDLKSLPLNPELSREVYENWDRGNKTELYEKIERIL